MVAATMFLESAPLHEAHAQQPWHARGAAWRCGHALLWRGAAGAHGRACALVQAVLQAMLI